LPAAAGPKNRLAKKEGKSAGWITQRLRFGRFLTFLTTVSNSESLPLNLTERRFRQYWERTDKSETNERIRFLAVRRLIESETVTVTRHRRRPTSRPSRRVAYRNRSPRWQMLNHGLAAHRLKLLEVPTVVARGDAEARLSGTTFATRAPAPAR
jgi:hypothetical protein